MTKFKARLGAIAIAITAAGFAHAAMADDFLDAAKKKVEVATMSKSTWDGPTTGPKAAAGKTIVFVAADLKNGGILGVSKGVEEAAAAIGWKVRVIDGQGSVSGRTAALNQALALKPGALWSVVLIRPSKKSRSPTPQKRKSP